MSEWNADTSSVPSTRGLSRDDHHEESWHGKRHGKEVDVRLEVKIRRQEIGRVVEDGDTKVWDRVQLRSYNGELVGPTLEAEPGDTLNISLENKLPGSPPGLG